MDGANHASHHGACGGQGSHDTQSLMRGPGVTWHSITHAGARGHMALNHSCGHMALNHSCMAQDYCITMSCVAARIGIMLLPCQRHLSPFPLHRLCLSIVDPVFLCPRLFFEADDGGLQRRYSYFELRKIIHSNAGTGIINTDHRRLPKNHAF